MKIGFVGAGKVGCTLGLYLGQQNEIVGYASRSYNSAKEAAVLTGSKAFMRPIDLARNCELIYFTTPDGIIETAWESLLNEPEIGEIMRGKIVAHTSGSLSSEIFHGAQELGAFPVSTHPLYAISSKTGSAAELGSALFAIEGDSARIGQVEALLKNLGNKVQVIPTLEKTRYHAAAVLASNHVVALYSIAAHQLEECGFSKKDAAQALAPLFLGNAEHIAKRGPLKSLTGPAERGDLGTIAKHLSVLSGRSRDVYEILNEEALEIASMKHDLGL